MARTERERQYKFDVGVKYAEELVATNMDMARILDPQDEDDEDVMAGIDAEAFCCEICAHWCDRSEEAQSMPGVCDECERDA